MSNKQLVFRRLNLQDRYFCTTNGQVCDLFQMGKLLESDTNVAVLCPHMGVITPFVAKRYKALINNRRKANDRRNSISG